MNIGYCRVGIEGMSNDEQKSIIMNLNQSNLKIDKWIEESCSFMKDITPIWESISNYVSAGDTIFVAELSLITSDVETLNSILHKLSEINVSLVSIAEHFDLNANIEMPFTKAIEILCEIKNRTAFLKKAERKYTAKLNGQNYGRKKIEVDEKLLTELMKEIYEGKKTRTEIAKSLNISRGTLNELMKQNTSSLKEKYIEFFNQNLNK